MKIVETVGGSITSTKQFALGEERDGSGNVTKLFFDRGEVISGSAYFYVKDHLGSIRTMTDVSGNIQASYKFDSYGVKAASIETIPADFQYAGYYYHSRSRLSFTTHRLYSPSLSAWLSRDPAGGNNLYAYVNGNPLNATDPLGLAREGELQILWLPVKPGFGLPEGWHADIIVLNKCGEITDDYAGDYYLNLTHLPFPDGIGLTDLTKLRNATGPERIQKVKKGDAATFRSALNSGAATVRALLSSGRYQYDAVYPSAGNNAVNSNSIAFALLKYAFPGTWPPSAEVVTAGWQDIIGRPGMYNR